MVSAALVVSTPLVDVPGMRQQVSESACRWHAAAVLYVLHTCIAHSKHTCKDLSLSLTIWQCHQSAITIVVLQQLLLGDNMLFESCYTSLRHHHSTC